VLAGADTCSGLSLAALAPAGAGDTPVAVAAGDFDRDGKLDVAAVNQSTASVTILIGDGMGGFTAGPNSPISIGAANPIDIAAGDLDQDGMLDLVVAFGGGAQAEVLRGLGGVDAGKFAASGPFALNAIPTRIYLALLTSDADLDLVVLAEGARRLLVYGGASGTAFNPAALSNLDLTQPPFSAVGEQPSGAAPLDFNRDGKLDLAVVMRNTNTLWVLGGNGGGGLSPGPSIGVGSGPRDVAAADVDRDGWPDLVTANSGSGDASVLRNSAGSSLAPSSVAVGGTPIRVALLDLNHDAVLDLVALDEAAVPGARMVGVLGLETGPPFFQATPLYPENLPGATPAGLAVGDFTADGRLDLVTALSGPRQVVVVENRSGAPCVGTSFGSAPRAYAAGDGPVSTAAADFDRDGRTDLAVAAEFDKKVFLLKNAAGHFALPTASVDVSPAIPAAVATADFDSDGIPDVAVASSGTDLVQVFRGDGLGGLITPASATQGVGLNPSALVVGDFDGDGIPDLAAAAEGSGFVYVYLGDGLGGLAPGIQTGVGAGPRALVTGFFDADARLDLAVANANGNSATILLGDGDGTFTEAPGSPVSLGAGTGPSGIAAGDIDGDMDTDLVTANTDSATASVLVNSGGGDFTLVTSHPVPGPNPTAVALLDLTGDTAPELAVTSRGNRTLTVFTNAGGTFTTPYDYPVRSSPRAITPLDMDADGRLDLAVPCWQADSVAVLLSRPPVLLEAPRLDVGLQPSAIVAADLDGDGDLDLAVPSEDDIVSLHRNDGSGVFTPFPIPSYSVAGVGEDQSIVAADFNRDGRVDLALNTPENTPSVAILFGAGPPGEFAAQPPVPLPGTFPDELAVGDFDRDGDLDLAVCDKQSSGAVMTLRNDAGVFSLASTVTNVGDTPTAIVAGDFDRDGDLDLAVANAISANIRILVNDMGGFTLGALLPLAGPDLSPLSITAGDFDGDGDLDLAAAAFGGDRIHVYRNDGGGTFGPPVPFAAPATLQSVMAADLSLDGKPDLVAVAAGLVAFRGKGGLDFEPPETWVAGLVPWAAAVADFNRDGRPDAAIANQDSDDVSVLLSTTCLPRRLEVALQPLACEGGAPDYFQDVEVEARDDGGNLAACATGVVKPSIAPFAVLGPPAVVAGGLPLSNGVASFTDTNALSIDRAGRRFRLQFVLEDTPPPNLAPALSRPFTLGPGTVEIVGPPSFCAGGSAVYQTLDPPEFWDDYRWTVDGQPVAFTPAAQLTSPPIMPGSHMLGLTTRIEGCSDTAATPVTFHVGDLQPPVTLQIQGGNSVCVDCIGGSAKAQTTGGGPLAYQWGYRTEPGVGMPVPIPGENADVYVLKGASFPGPGDYFVVATVSPTCGSAQESNEWMVTVDNVSLSGEVLHLAASSRGGPSTGENQLRWVNTSAPLEIRIRWNKAPDGTNDCLPPASLTSPPNNPPATDETVITSPPPNAMDGRLYTGLVLNTAYCYSVFVKTGAGWSPGRTVKARPFDSTLAAVKWAYATGGTAVAPPTVAAVGLTVLSNDQTVHSLTRGDGGGDWTASFTPRSLMGVAHSRSPVVPFDPPLLTFFDSVLFVADDSSGGLVHAVDAETGSAVWPAQAQGAPITGAPGGMFQQFGAIRDALFVGTRVNAAANAFRALDPADGTLLHAYTGEGSPAGPNSIGPISGTPAVAYPNLVYFASRKLGAGDTLFCLEVRTAAPVLVWRWSRDLGDIVGSPVLRGGRIYVGAEDGTIYSLDAATGLGDRRFEPTPADGPVKGFLFPDRRSGRDDLVFATDTRVWSISDDGGGAFGMSENWQWDGAGNPSLVLQWPQTDFVYVGGPNGVLYQLDTSLLPASPGFAKSLTLGGGVGAGQIGAPSLDIGTPKLLVVGSEPGVVYGVTVPF
jgi:outer membrane protein assembly factor BamB